MLTVLRIIWDVATYRLRRLEMANLAAATSLMVALRLELVDFLVRIAFAVVLNLLAYLINDILDAPADLAAGRAPDKTRFLLDHRASARAAVVVLSGSLITVAVVWRIELILAAVLGAGICWAYTVWLKRTAIGDLFGMFLWGAAMPLVGVPLDRTLGWVLVAQLGLFSMVFESIQVTRDREADAAAGLVTTAVAVSPAVMPWLVRGLLLGAATCAIALLSPWAALPLLAALVLPVRLDRPNRYWNQMRFWLGLAWLAIIGQVVLQGESAGALVRVAYDATWL